MAKRIFGGKGSYEKYSLVERRDLDLKVKEFKQQYLLELEALKGKTHWNAKTKCRTRSTKTWLLEAAVRSCYSKLRAIFCKNQAVWGILQK